MAKVFSQRLFAISPDLTISCTCEDTRYGFRHLAKILRGEGWMTGDKPAKACYYNRTWESFEFQTVLQNLADNKTNSLTDAERTAIRNTTWRD